jgi:hypothetical protein
MDRALNPAASKCTAASKEPTQKHRLHRHEAPNIDSKTLQQHRFGKKFTSPHTEKIFAGTPAMQLSAHYLASILLHEGIGDSTHQDRVEEHQPTQESSHINPS